MRIGMLKDVLLGVPRRQRGRGERGDEKRSVEYLG